jgi:hypothetical protein
MPPSEFDRLLEKLVKDVEAAVHALYRGEVRQSTAKARTDHLLNDARVALAAAALGGGAGPALSEKPSGPSPRPRISAPMHAGVALGWTTPDSDAVIKCIQAWLPVGGTASTPPDSKCIAAGKMLIPTWAERELAREAVKRITED